MTSDPYLVTFHSEPGTEYPEYKITLLYYFHILFIYSVNVQHDTNSSFIRPTT